MAGAGLATALGALLTWWILLTHFLRKQCTLRLCKPYKIWRQIGSISGNGASTFFIDIAMGILTMLFNRQIIRYLGTDALAVYGILVNISTVVQCCAYSVGQAAQPILSINFGAQQGNRIKATLRYALYSVAFFSLAWTLLICWVPNAFVQLFMAPTEGILQIAPFILRSYGISFLLLPLNVFSTYYFQSLMRPLSAFLISVARGLLVSGALIYFLPYGIGASAIWYAMPITEVLVAIPVVVLMRRCTKTLPQLTSL